MMSRKMKAIALPLVCGLLLSLLSCSNPTPTNTKTTTTEKSSAIPAVQCTCSVDNLNAVVHPCEIPEGYVYPADAADYYKDHKIWLEDGFYRPDLIWHFCADPIDEMTPGAGTANLYLRFQEDYPDARYAVQLQIFQRDEYDLTLLVAYLEAKGWEYLRMQNGWPEFAATRDQLEKLNCNELIHTIVETPQYGINIFPASFSGYHPHETQLPPSDCWSCEIH